MHDERPEGIRGSDESHGDTGADSVGALISSAGKRQAPPQDAYDEVLAGAHEAWQRKLRARRGRRWGYALAATVGALAVGVGVTLLRGPGVSAPIIATAGLIQGDVRLQGPGQSRWSQLDRASGPILAGTRLRSTPNGRVALALRDGASLRVDASTELLLGGDREIDLMRGIIYLDSGADVPTAPFRVVTPLGSVSDVGTQFEVAASDDLLRVRVREGSVSVRHPMASETHLGRAGDELSLVMDGTLERDYVSPFDPDWAWVETLADTPQVEGQSLLLFLDWVARETGRPLRFDAPVTETRARTVILHGNADGLTPMQALDVMLSTTDFDYRLRGDGAIEISPRPR